jgi:Zn-dependent peptidase ImmA (M78 family)
VKLDRFDLADIHNPGILAGKIHTRLGSLASAVPVVEIALALDIADVRLDRYDGFEGMLLTNARRSTGGILANTTKGDRRARFTVAHELGHFLMERHQLSSETGFRCSARDMRETRAGRQHFKQEAQANQFAITLLAPAYLISPLLSPDPDLRDAQRLRDHLDVSLEACLRRMIEHRDDPLAAVWSHNGTVRYFVKGGGFPFVALKTGDRIPKVSDAHRAITNTRPGFTGFAETHPHPWTGRTGFELYEQTRLAKNGHAVTLLWADLPDEDDGDGGLAELDTPGFR